MTLFLLVFCMSELILPIGVEIRGYTLGWSLIKLIKPEALGVGRVLVIDLRVGERVLHIKWQHSLFSIRLKKLIFNNGVEYDFLIRKFY